MVTTLTQAAGEDVHMVAVQDDEEQALRASFASFLEDAQALFRHDPANVSLLL